ncbi:hypothetical protein [Burkholderia glumae]|uniref:hypothetical protein n=1 Tax=Burkholderia glumae TaxID=337 RepID=UPI0021516CBD|nr:hypothetical protein [Burkholderia glumae]
MKKLESYRAELTFRASVAEVLRPIFARFLPAALRMPYRVRLIPEPREIDRPPLGRAWFRVERRVALIFWREIGAFSFGDMHGAQAAISADVIRRRIKRLRPTVVARADADGKVAG